MAQMLATNIKFREPSSTAIGLALGTIPAIINNITHADTIQTTPVNMMPTHTFEIGFILFLLYTFMSVMGFKLILLNEFTSRAQLLIYRIIRLSPAGKAAKAAKAAESKVATVILPSPLLF